MNDTQAKHQKQVTFSASRSQAQSLARDLAKNALSDITRNFIAPEHLVGTTGMLMYMFSLSQRAIGASKDREWLRTASNLAMLPSPFTTLVSSRSGAFPEAETFGERVKKAALHPDTHTMHASFVYGSAPALTAALIDIHKGITGDSVEAIRLAGGAMGIISQAMVWRSMFGKKDGVGDTSKLDQMGKKDNFLQFMLHDVEGLSARLLPLAIRLVGLTEGIVKTKSDRPSGKNFTVASGVDLASYLIHVGYTYQQLWKAHKEANSTAHSSTWTKEILDEKAAKLYTAPAKNR